MKNTFKVNDYVYCFFNNHPVINFDDSIFSIDEWLPPYTDVLEAYLEGSLPLVSNKFKITKIDKNYVTLDPGAIIANKYLIYSVEKVKEYISKIIAPEAEKYNILLSKYMEAEKLLKNICSLKKLNFASNNTHQDISLRLNIFLENYKL